MFDHTKSFAISADNLRSPLRFPRPYPAIGAVERNPTVKELAAVYKLLIPAREVT